MLVALHIRNFALIDRLDISFGSGLNILTGETGAGKSIIIDALGMVLGERASVADLVRSGEEKATIEAVFDLSNAPAEVASELREANLESDDEDGVLYVARELTRTGSRSQVRINGRLAPLSVLRKVTDMLVDVHGQHEHQSLLATDRHVDILDAWCGKEALAVRSRVAEFAARRDQLSRDLEELRSDVRERARTLDLLRYQSQEIEAARLRSDEDADLQAERNRLAGAEKLFESAATAHARLIGEESSGAVDAIYSALSGLEHAAHLDERLIAIVSSLREAATLADETAGELRRYRDQIEFNPQRLEEIESRLETIRSLKRKYGESVDEVIAYGAALAEKIDVLETAEVREDALERSLSETAAALGQAAEELSAIRAAGSKNLGSAIERELSELGMASTLFVVQIAQQPITARGADRVEFMMSPNVGEPLRPLSRIASGGELSRIMLALKSVMAQAGGVPSMIFDEIDVGVGGRAAETIANKLEALAKRAQVLCVTHLAQIASRAQTHLLIEKQSDGERSKVVVKTLSSEGRVEEIARMLGGSRRSDAVVQHAREMLAV